MATASATAARNHQRFRAPPPSPIATGKGLRSAAADDRVLSDFLDVSLRVPDLSLPLSHFPSKSPLKVPAEVDLGALVSGDECAVRRVLDEAAEIGAVCVVGGEALGEDVKTAIEVGKGVFETQDGETSRPDLHKKWFGRRDGIMDEFIWYRMRSPEMERHLQRTWPESYWALRDKMESVATRLDTVAECIACILSEHVTSQAPSKRIREAQSMLYLRKKKSPYGRNNTRESAHTSSHHCHALNLHICGDSHEFCIRHPEGSAIIMLPAGGILVTISKTLQEFYNGEFKSASAEALFQPADDPCASFSLEYACSPLVLSHAPDDGTRTISLSDQLLMALVLIILCNLWTSVFS
ncbi:uncharacterized protein LOC141824770 [Curcuma longa]|uniref:uncharacterized protein LOC141824770 n=1 Tax=Curcuma longa TaxID=136217 RepID=UPI003D9E926A